ncbi:hypothetical protein GWA01_11250 [Gluconobacter wancherniae NBRC 103581]|uniref:Uncharacterized protein n=1 Tax=Gluconobacter wancherniae NBRC 103581 TaxID=656744 RepID=A0A511AYR4_9PROT|nr:hypothetical protein AA103581_2238 [Gluconobacter wancherniae NBRC 103581]GEK93355.1 hypothetical protein GWA01_11250 [Gluconobacter wancherniae NBRC 103581]
MKSSSADAQLPEASHLIVHQGDQGRDNKAHTVPAQCGDLIAEALSPASRHEDKNILTTHNGFDGLRLKAAKCRKAEYPCQNMFWRGSGLNVQGSGAVTFHRAQELLGVDRD